MERWFSSSEATPDLPEWLNALSESVIGAAIEVHRALGLGLLERIYEEALLHELQLRGHAVEQQVTAVVRYKDREIVGQRIDLVVERVLVVEVKAIEKLPDIAMAQLLGYLRAGPFPLGLVINFHSPILHKGVYRRANSDALGFINQLPVSNSATSA